ncbi:MAG: trigger factor [Blautia sp.]|nr:trigger factor [Blautia sp.]
MKKRIALAAMALGLMMSTAVSADEFRIVSVDDAASCVKLGTYKGMELEKLIVEVTDVMVDTQIETELQSRLVEVSDATAEDGDTTVIDFVGKKDGVEFEGGSATQYTLVLGSGTFIPGFEEGVIGMKVGETKDLDLTFPESYGNADLAGQAVVFTVTLDAVKRMPELTDEWVKANTDSKTVEEYKEAVRAKLNEQAAAYSEENLKTTAFGNVYDGAEVSEYPEADIEKEKATAQEQIENYAKWSSMTLEEFLESQGMTLESFEEYKQDYAEFKVKQNLVVQAVIDAEKLSMEDEASKKIIDTLLASYQVENLENLVESYGETAVHETVALLRVEQFLVDEAVIKEVTQEEAAAEAAAQADTAEEAGEAEEGSEAQTETKEAAAETAEAETEKAEAAADEAAAGAEDKK